MNVSVCASSEVSGVAVQMRGSVTKYCICAAEKNREAVMFYLLMSW